jgi:hypothetical protein
LFEFIELCVGVFVQLNRVFFLKVNKHFTLNGRKDKLGSTYSQPASKGNNKIGVPQEQKKEIERKKGSHGWMHRAPKYTPMGSSPPSPPAIPAVHRVCARTWSGRGRDFQWDKLYKRMSCRSAEINPVCVLSVQCPLCRL